MVKKLLKHGNSLALVIDKPILDLLKIHPETPLDVSTDGQVLVITPIRDETHQRTFKRALEATNKKYSRVLRRLAE